MKSIAEADLKELLTEYAQKAEMDADKAKASSCLVFLAILICMSQLLVAAGG